MSRSGPHRRALRQIQLVASDQNQSGSINVPDVPILPGDLLVFNQYSQGIIAEPTYGSPAGWEEAYSTAGSGEWQAAGGYYKIADGTERNTSVSGIDATGTDNKTIAVLRGSRPFKSCILMAAATWQNTNGDPTAQDILSGGARGPVVVVANYGGNSGPGTLTFSPTEDHEIGSGTNMRTRLKSMLGDNVDVSADKNDNGDRNHLASYALLPSIYDEEQVTTASLENSSSSSTFSVNTPSTVQPGDALFLFDRASNASGSGPASSPDTDWIELATVAGNPHRFSIYGKIAAEGDASLSVAGATGNTTNHHVVLSFRGDRPFQTMTAFSPVSVAPTSSNPADVVITDQSKDKVRLHLASYSASGAVSPRTMSPAKDGEVTPATVFYAAYRVLAAGAALGDTTVGMDDEGTGNTLLAVGVELT